jgi:hypothetical protein
LNVAEVLFEPRKFTRQTSVRFRRRRTKELIAHVGGQPTTPQLILIRRIVANEWDLRRLDEQFSTGELSGHSMRARLAMENRLRLDLRELGMKPAEVLAPTLAETMAAAKRARLAKETAA